MATIVSRLLGVSLLAVLFGGLASYPEGADLVVKLSPAVAHREVPSTYFAMNLAGSAWKHPWPTIDVGAVRIFDSAWEKVEPRKGVWDFAHLDEDVANAKAHKADVAFILFTTPTWASSRPLERGPFGYQQPGDLAEARNLTDWEEYVRVIGKRYKGRVTTYEMWNEPNQRDTYSGDIPNLVQLCRSAYRVLKEIDPSIQVVSPSPANVEGAAYVRSFIEQGGGDTFDVLGYHFYDNLGSKDIHPESMIGTAEQLRHILEHYKIGQKPIWNTESGYYISSGPNAKTHYKVFPKDVHILSQDEAANAVARSYILGWATGIERFYWYAWGEPAYALVDDNGTSDKKATATYSTMSKWLIGATYVSVTHNVSGEWIVELRSRAGKVEHIAWASKDSMAFTVPPEWKATESEDLLAAKTQLKDSGLMLTGEPTLIQ